MLAVYNDYSTLPMAVNSIRDHCDFITVADGAYKLYYQTYKKSNKDAKPWSTDGSIEVLKAIPSIKDKLKIIDCPEGGWANQCVKRTALLDSVPEGDWFIILDSDEIFYGDVELGLNEIMRSGCISGTTPLYNAGLDVSGFQPYWHPRVFLKLDGMHYDRKHWNLMDKDRRVVENHWPVKWTDAMVLTHLKVFRGHGRLAPHLGYMHMMSLDGWMEPEKITGKLKAPQHFNIEQ